MWGLLTKFWTVFYIAFIVLNFLSRNKYAFLVGSLSALYIGALSIYVGSKEFDRWYADHESRRHGEIFVVAFTVVIAALLGGALFFGEAYRVPSDIVATYIAVLSVFILTQKSKRWYERKGRKRTSPPC